MANEKPRFITPIFRLDYPNLFQMTQFRTEKPSYNMKMIFEPYHTIDPKNLKGFELDEYNRFKAIKDYIDNLIASAYPKGIPVGFNKAFRYGNSNDYPNGVPAQYENKIVCTAKTYFPPQVVDARNEYITEDSKEIYRGCYAQASISAFLYQNASRGCGINFTNVRKVRNGEVISGGVSAKSEFAGLELPSHMTDDSAFFESSFDL